MSLGSIPDDIRVPLIYIEIDNSQALSSAPAQSRKAIVIGHQLTGGTAAALTQNRITSDGTAENLYGKGSQLAEMLKMFRKANSYTETYGMGINDLEAGTAAKATLKITGAATAAGTLALMINGIPVKVGVSVGDDPVAVTSAIIAATSSKPNTQVTAALKATTTDTVELMAVWKGEGTNAMDVRLNYYPGEKLPAGIAVAVTDFAGGSGTPDITAVVAALGDDWYTDIVFAFNDTESLNTIRDELVSRWGPLKMIEAQLWSGYRGTHAETGTYGDARNDWLISNMSTNIAPQPHWLWAASYGGIASYYLAIDPARPLQTLVMPGILAPEKEVRWDMPERNLLLHDGMATHFVDAGGNVCIEREITMYRVNQFGDPDTSYLDVQSPATLGRIRYIIKNRFSNRYPRHKLAGDDVLELLDPGQPVITPKIARGELLDIALTELVPAGLVEDFDDYKDTLDVEIDSNDANRLNFLAHPNLVNQLRTLAGLIQFKQ